MLKKEDFERHLTTIFEVMPVGMTPVPIELVQVEDKSSAALDVFSLMFKGSMDNVFHHDTHRVRHAAMGELDIFIGPVHTGKMDSVYYQAIFSAHGGCDNRNEAGCDAPDAMQVAGRSSIFQQEGGKG